MFNLKIIFFTFHLFTVCYTREPFPDKSDNNFQKECLIIANNYRRKHQAPPFKINKKAVDYSKQRCQIISRKEGLKHGYDDLRDDFGENQFFKGGTGLALCSNAVEHWYDQEDEFDYKKPEGNNKADHFTQLVWKGTTGIGCARCGGTNDKSKKFETYVVCDFIPPGNTEGEFKDNVAESSEKSR